MTGIIYNDLVKHDGEFGSPEEFLSLVQEVSDVIDDYGQPHSLLGTPHDVKGIIETIRSLELAREPGERRTGRQFHLNLRRIAQHVSSMKTSVTISSEENLLNKKTNPTKTDKYEYILSRYVADKGVPVSPEADIYGWRDYEMTNHVRGYGREKPPCGIGAVTAVMEDDWDEFTDTYTEDDPTVHGITADARCNCGFFQGQIRVEGQANVILYEVINNYE